MKIKGFILSALLGCAVLVTGCGFDQIAGPYDGPTVLEFDQVGGKYTATVPENAGNVELKVNLVGPQRGADTAFSVKVAEGSTAVEGTHFSFPNGKTFNIPANSSTGTVTVSIPETPLEAGQNGRLVLELEGQGDVQVAENWKTFTLTISGQ